MFALAEDGMKRNPIQNARKIREKSCIAILQLYHPTGRGGNWQEFIKPGQLFVLQRERWLIASGGSPLKIVGEFDSLHELHLVKQLLG